ncbi:MAG TPA: hypothetical protein VIG72_13415 [Pontibacter sp.]
MNTTQIKAFALAALFGGAVTLSGCNTGTDPGDTNTERGDIVEEGSGNQGYTSEEYPADSDTANLEKYYDHADHENHGDNKAGAVHAGDGKTEGRKRGESGNQ